MVEILKVISQKFRVVVLSDEEELYNEASLPYFSHLQSIHLLGSRPKPPLNPAYPRINRIENHCHPLLKAELQRLISCYQPHLVQIEYGELVNLMGSGKQAQPWVLTLHDVLLSEGRLTKEDRYELAAIRRYDEVLVCSPEDASLLPNSRLVPNGFEKDKHPYRSSAQTRLILFAGPFRYAPNWSGIQQFLQTVYPQLQKTVPHLAIAILGLEAGGRRQGAGGIYLIILKKAVNLGSVTINPMYGANIKNIYH
jgi:hypothetical protein